MVEKLAHPNRVVLAVFRFRQTVVFAAVLQHHPRLLEPAQSVVVFHPLREIDRAVLVVMQYYERRLHFRRMVDRRIADVRFLLVPVSGSEPSLAASEDWLVGRTSIPVHA